MLTLYTPPVVYLYLDRALRWFRRQRGASPARSGARAGAEAASS